MATFLLFHDVMIYGVCALVKDADNIKNENDTLQQLLSFQVSDTYMFRTLCSGERVLTCVRRCASSAAPIGTSDFSCFIASVQFPVPAYLLWIMMDA